MNIFNINFEKDYADFEGFLKIAVDRNIVCFHRSKYNKDVMVIHLMKSHLSDQTKKYSPIHYLYINPKSDILEYVIDKNIIIIRHNFNKLLDSYHNKYKCETPADCKEICMLVNEEGESILGAY
jgi:hypothetical protein